MTVNGNALPPLLLDFIQSQQWCHPGDEALRKLIPFPMDPVDFLTTVDSIDRETSGLLRMSDDSDICSLFLLSRGSRESAPVVLPWLDAERAVCIAVNRSLGDDVAIVLDYRRSTVDPAVVASHWAGPSLTSPWAEICGSFTEFAERLGLRS